jgi:DNA-binding SARP family transcriptional activator/uncharacterized protein HemY
MEFRTLGPIELWSAGQRQDLGSARARSLLAMLLLTPRAMIPVETLIDRLWDERPPPKARESLSVYVARLRASLRRGAGDSVRLAGRTQGGYLLEVEPDAIDLHRFRRLRRQATALAASGDYEQASGLLREADGLWRGQPLAGIRGDWVTRMRDALEEERRSAITELIGCELELGRHADLVGELRHLLTRYPLDETLVAHQMTALYRNGRQADALSLYRETRSRLIEDQGAEPGAELAELHQRVLARDPALATGPAGRPPAQPAAADTLPPQTTEFVGREDELGLLTAEHGGEPWLAVIEGLPGVGKTALAVRAARQVRDRYPDGTLYLNLHSHNQGNPPLQPAEALYQLLRESSVPAAQIPKTVAERAALWRAHLSRRRVVVILDDAATVDQIRPLLPQAGRCLILITTRRRFAGLTGARTLTLDVLSASEAAALFRQVAGQRPEIAGEQVAATVDLCGRLPLAIQLTAGRIAQTSPPSLDGLIEEWSQSAALLGGTGVASPEVIAAFDLSYRALAPGHQRLFRLLGISPCATHSPAAAAALADCTLAEAEQSLDVLLDCHLLTPAQDDRYRLHDLIRGYAATRARRDDAEAEQRQAVTRLLAYYLLAAGQADQVLHPLRHRPAAPGTGPQPGRPAPVTAEDAKAWLDAEWRNILQAASYAGRHEWKQECTDLSYLLADYLEIRAFWEEAITAHTVALEASRYLADPARIARAALALSVVRQQTGRHETAISLAEEAAAIYRSLADRRGEAESLDQIGLANQRTARSREALAYFQEARLKYEAAADSRGVADTLSHSGIACWHLGRYREAYDQLRSALAQYQEIGDRRGEAKALNNLGRVHLYNGHYPDALDAYQRSLQIFTAIGGPQNEAILHQNIGTVYRCQGNYEEALDACRRAVGIYRDIGDLPDEADALNDIGAIYQSAACFDEALVHHQRAQVIAEEIGNLSQQLVARRMLADIHRGSGRYEEALEHYRAALKIAREIGDPYEEGKILEGIAEGTLYTHRRDAARIALRQALDIFERLGVPEAASARNRMDAMDPALAIHAS